MTSITARAARRPVAVFLNAARLNYDKKLNLERLASLTELIQVDVDYLRDPEELLRRVQGAEIVITKEMVVPADVFEKFPSSVKLMCEAGTGFNNLPCASARSRGVVVCNVPTYSTDAVAHMAITHLLSLSCSLIGQQRMLFSGDRSNFTGPFTLPLMEHNGKTLGLVGGSGRIGSKVADVALALGMDIIISSRSGKLPHDHRHASHPNVRCVSSVDHMDILLKESDFVSIHCPLNDETRVSRYTTDATLCRLSDNSSFFQTCDFNNGFHAWSRSRDYFHRSSVGPT